MEGVLGVLFSLSFSFETMKTHHAVGRWKMKVTDVGRSFTGAVI